MKVDGNDPVFAQKDYEGRGYIHASMPIRLEIATQILAALAVNAWRDGVTPEQFEKRSVKMALGHADALIAAHNETCGGEE